MHVEMVDVTSLAANFPESPSSPIPRDAVIHMIEDRFDDENNTVLLDGKDGTGKTEVLRQFSLKHEHNVLALFLKPHSTLPNAQSILSESILEQTQFLDNGTIDSTARFEQEQLASTYSRITRRATRSGQPLYVVLDGLFEAGSPDENLKEFLWGILPIGFGGVRYLFSIDLSSSKPQLHANLKERVVSVPPFSPEESRELLKDSIMDDRAVEELHNSFHGYPGPLSRVLRLAGDASSTPFDVDDLPQSLKDLFAFEWAGVDLESESAKVAFSVLAFDNVSRDINSIAEITGLSESILTEIFSIPPIRISPNTAIVEFVSETHRRYIRDKLQSEKRRAFTQIVRFLKQQSQSHDTVIGIASYLTQDSDNHALIDHLDKGNLEMVAQGATSTHTLREVVHSGLSAASTLRDLSNVAKFSILNASLESLSKQYSLKFRTRMLALTGHEQQAIAVAKSLPIAEDRLLAMSEIARALSTDNKVISLGIYDDIKELISTLGTETDKSKAINIGVNLMYVYPEVATSFLRSVLGGTNGADPLESVFALNSLTSSSTQMTSEPQSDGPTSDDTEEEVYSTQVAQLSSAMGAALKTFSAEVFLDQVSKIGDPENKLLLFRIWCRRNRSAPKSIRVATAGLQHLVANTNLIATSTILHDLAMPLPHAEPADKLSELIAQFDAQISVVEDLGPFEDHIRLKLALARATTKLEHESARDRFVQCFLDVMSHPDAISKFTVLASLLSSLHSSGMSVEMQEREGLVSLIEDELDKLQDEILVSSADQYSALGRAILSLTKVDSTRALLVADSLNTRGRRDEAFSDIILYQLDRPRSEANWDLIKHCLDKISSEQFRQETSLIIYRSLDSAQPPIETSKWLIGRLKSFESPKTRLEASARLLVHLSANDNGTELQGVQKSLAKQISDLARNEIEKTGNSESLLETSVILHPERPDLSKRLVQLVLDHGPLIDKAESNSFVNSIRFALRSAHGLIMHGYHDLADLETITNLIEQITDEFVKALLWSELTLYLVAAKSIDQGRHYCNTYLIPSLEVIKDYDKARYAQALVAVAPSLFRVSPPYATSSFDELSRDHRDQAYSAIINHILQGTFPWDPPASHPGHKKLTFTEVEEVLLLIEKLQEDGALYWAISKLAMNFVESAQTATYTESQKLSTSARLSAIIHAKLPDPENISHEGYLICAEARLQQIRGKNAPDGFWEDLFARTKMIPNTSDIAFVSIELASAIPSRLTLSREIKAYALNSSSTISSEIDRIDRLTYLAQGFAHKDAGLTKQALEAIKNFGPESLQNSSMPVHKRAIELAYRVSRELASQLVGVLDNDPARPARVKSELVDYLERLDLEKELYSSGNNLKINEISPHDLPLACWNLLADLNGSQISPLQDQRLRQVSQRASVLESEDFYPVGALLIQNAIAVSGNKKNIPDLLLSLHSKMIETAQVIASFENAGVGLRNSVSPLATQLSAIGQVIVEPGDRDLAMEIVRNWVIDNDIEHLRICDPYFDPSDLEVLKWILDRDPEIRVTILTSQHNVNKQGNTDQFLENCRTTWGSYSKMDPPETEIVVVSYAGDDQAPIHDRCWLAQESGLRFGTSFKSLGREKVSEITLLDDNEATALAERLSGYFDRTRRREGLSRLDYKSLLL